MMMITDTAAEALKSDIAGQLTAIARTNRWHYCFGTDDARVRSFIDIAANATRTVLDTCLADLTPETLLEIGTMILALAIEIDADQPTKCFR